MNRDQLQELFEQKYRNGNIDLCRDTMEKFVDGIVKLLYPALCSKSARTIKELEKSVEDLKNQLAQILSCLHDELGAELKQKSMIEDFFGKLPILSEKMDRDAQFLLHEDPAARSLNEVMICYPGFYAAAVYRIANYFFHKELPLFPRILTEYAHRRTGIDIHPGAMIGCPFFIDHGTGVVIGETAVIGDRVKIYQGVTLGSISVAKDMKGTKRHPTIEDDVVIYANATILGGDTVIGKGSVIGGGVWLIESVEENTRIFNLKTTQSQ